MVVARCQLDVCHVAVGGSCDKIVLEEEEDLLLAMAEHVDGSTLSVMLCLAEEVEQRGLPQIGMEFCAAHQKGSVDMQVFELWYRNESLSA
jgi:hypothetical protein